MTFTHNSNTTEPSNLSVVTQPHVVTQSGVDTKSVQPRNLGNSEMRNPSESTRLQALAPSHKRKYRSANSPQTEPNQASNKLKKTKSDIDFLARVAFLDEYGFSDPAIEKIFKTTGSKLLVDALEEDVVDTGKNRISLLQEKFSRDSLVKILSNNGANQLIQTLFKPLGDGQEQTTYLDRLITELGPDNTVKILGNGGANQLIQTLFKHLGDGQEQTTYLDRLITELGPDNTVKLLNHDGANQLIQTLFKPLGAGQEQTTYLDRLIKMLGKENAIRFIKKRRVHIVIEIGFKTEENQYRINRLQSQKNSEFINFMTVNSTNTIKEALQKQGL